jgi:hypothetical protein
MFSKFCQARSGGVHLESQLVRRLKKEDHWDHFKQQKRVTVETGNSYIKMQRFGGLVTDFV